MSKVYFITNRKTNGRNKDNWNKPDDRLKCFDVELRDSAGNFFSKSVLNDLIAGLDPDNLYDLADLTGRLDAARETILLGYDTSFVDSVLTGAKILKNFNMYSDQAYDPNLIVFSWPSLGKMNYPDKYDDDSHKRIRRLGEYGTESIPHYCNIRY